MHWLFLLLAIGALAVAFRTTSMLLMGVAAFASLSLFVAWAVARYNARVGSTQRDESLMIDPDELRRMRELAEARRVEAAAKAAAAPAVPEPRIHGRATFTLPDEPPRA